MQKAIGMKRRARWLVLDCLLSASYDLHGQVSKRIVDSLDAITAYRTRTACGSG